MSNEWQAFCNDAGIRRQHTIRAEPYQNGVAEHANRTIMKHTLALLNEAKLPGSFWWDAVVAYTHVRNCSPSTSLPSNKMPYELWHQSKPDVFHFRVFGCTAFVLVKKDKCIQLQPYTQKCIFIEYPTDYKGWLFWNPAIKHEVISNSAEFDERFFPGNSMNPLKWSLPPLGPSSDPVDQGEDGDSYDILSPPSGLDDDDDDPPAPLPLSTQEQDRPHTPPAPPLSPKQDSPRTPPPLIPGKRTVTHGIKYDCSPSE